VIDLCEFSLRRTYFFRQQRITLDLSYSTFPQEITRKPSVYDHDRGLILSNEQHTSPSFVLHCTLSCAFPCLSLRSDRLLRSGACSAVPERSATEKTIFSLVHWERLYDMSKDMIAIFVASDCLVSQAFQFYFLIAACIAWGAAFVIR
jgi:hypothetical protein